MPRADFNEATEARLIELQKSHITALQETWVCGGPNRVGGFAGTKPATGEPVHYKKCLTLADCSCARFQQQARKIESLEEQMEDLLDPNRRDDEIAF